MKLRRVSPGIVATAAVMVAVGLGVPLVVDQFQLLQLTVFASMCILALSLGVVWGYGGILCFGQSAFFGLGAYTYAVTAVNLAESTLAILLSIVVPAVFAALLGYFMFYGRLSDVYLGVITLSVTLILLLRRHPLAPQAALAVGIGTVLGVTAVHVAPERSLFNDSYAAAHADALSCDATIDSRWRSMLRDRSKHTDVGAAISVMTFRTATNHHLPWLDERDTST